MYTTENRICDFPDIPENQSSTITITHTQNTCFNNKLPQEHAGRKTKLSRIIPLPAHDLVFQILSNNIIIARRWAKSPSKRNIFMFYYFTRQIIREDTPRILLIQAKMTWLTDTIVRCCHLFCINE